MKLKQAKHPPKNNGVKQIKKQEYIYALNIDPVWILCPI
jgi:hypothetical protein